MSAEPSRALKGKVGSTTLSTTALDTGAGAAAASGTGAGPLRAGHTESGPASARGAPGERNQDAATAFSARGAAASEHSSTGNAPSPRSRKPLRPVTDAAPSGRGRVRAACAPPRRDRAWVDCAGSGLPASCSSMSRGSCAMGEAVSSMREAAVRNKWYPHGTERVQHRGAETPEQSTAAGTAAR